MNDDITKTLIYIHLAFALSCDLATFRVLLGAEKSFVFDFSENSVTLRRGIQLSHLTPVSLNNYVSNVHVCNTQMLCLIPYPCSCLFSGVWRLLHSWLLNSTR